MIKEKYYNGDQPKLDKLYEMWYNNFGTLKISE